MKLIAEGAVHSSPMVHPVMATLTNVTSSQESEPTSSSRLQGFPSLSLRTRNLPQAHRLRRVLNCPSWRYSLLELLATTPGHRIGQKCIPWSKLQSAYLALRYNSDSALLWERRCDRTWTSNASGRLLSLTPADGGFNSVSLSYFYSSVGC